MFIKILFQIQEKSCKQELFRNIQDFDINIKISSCNYSNVILFVYSDFAKQQNTIITYCQYSFRFYICTPDFVYLAFTQRLVA